MPWMAIIPGLLSAAGSVAGGIMGGNSSKAAANAAAAQQERALAFQQQVYGNEAGQFAPYIGTGTNALYSLSNLYGLGNGPSGQGAGAQAAFNQFTTLPSYQFPLQQGELAANRALAAQGLTGSGAQGKALTQYGSGFASGQFNNYVAQLASLAGLGQSSIGALGGAGNQAAGTMLQGFTGVGNAQAAGIMGSNNAMASGIQGALGALGNNNANSSYGASSPLGQLISYLGSSGGGSSSGGSGFTSTPYTGSGGIDPGISSSGTY